MLLRVAIGWHFGTEGREKLKSYETGGKPFTAEDYLRNATGPLSPYFRGMLPDPNSFAKLDPNRLEAQKIAWRSEVESLATHYAITGDKKTEAVDALNKALSALDAWSRDRETREKVGKYFHDLGTVQATEKRSGAMSFERERAAETRKRLDTDRRDLVKNVDAIHSKLRDDVLKLASPEQAAAAGPPKPARTPFDTMNTFVTYSLIAIGFCMMGGLFTRLASLGGAIFLLNIYLSMPPWPGLPQSPKWEGHYYIVDKNLVEAIACLALACLPTGHWIGLDALVFGKRRHMRELAEARMSERIERVR